MNHSSAENKLTNGAVSDWYHSENIKDFTVVVARDMLMEKFRLENCVSASRLNSKLKDLIKKTKSLKYKKTLASNEKYTFSLTDQFTVLSEDPRRSGIPRPEVAEANEEKKCMKRKILMLEKEVKSKSLKQLENEALLEVVVDEKEKMRDEICELKEELVTKEKEQNKVLSSTNKEKEDAKKETARQVRKQENAKEKTKAMKETIKDLTVKNIKLTKSIKSTKSIRREYEGA